MQKPGLRCFNSGFDCSSRVGVLDFLLPNM